MCIQLSYLCLDWFLICFLILQFTLFKFVISNFLCTEIVWKINFLNKLKIHYYIQKHDTFYFSNYPACWLSGSILIPINLNNWSPAVSFRCSIMVALFNTGIYNECLTWYVLHSQVIWYTMSSNMLQFVLFLYSNIIHCFRIYSSSGYEVDGKSSASSVLQWICNALMKGYVGYLII